MGKPQLQILINLAARDGLVAEKEARLIKSIGRANGFNESEIDEMLSAPEELSDPLYLSDDQKFEYIYNVIQLMKADGQVFKSEIDYCEKLADQLGFKKTVVGELSSRIYSDPTITADRDMLRERAFKHLK